MSACDPRATTSQSYSTEAPSCSWTLPLLLPGKGEAGGDEVEGSMPETWAWMNRMG